MPRDPRSSLLIFEDIFEGSASEYQAELRDERDELLLSADITSITARIFDRDTKQIIMPETETLNTNGGSLTNPGIYNLKIPGEMHPVLNPRKTEEDHILHLRWTANSGATSGNHEVILRVRNLYNIS